MTHQTSASTHDSQVAIPLAKMSSERMTNLYDVMDSAYDVPQIHDMSRQLGHIPLIDMHPRRDKALKDELIRLRKEVEQLRMKRDLLKKAAVFFAKDLQ